jgi:uncharacterized membrane protein YhhN
MSSAQPKRVAILTAIAFLLTIAGESAGIPLLVYLCKPLTTILIALVAFTNWRAHRNLYARWITLGLIFSLAGDMLLLGPVHWFLFGLAAFLCAHIAYLIALTRDVRFPARASLWLLYVAAGAGIYSILWPGFTHSLRLPAALYTFFLFTMASQAMGRYLSLRTSTARLAAIGAIFFLLSDTLLTFDRFHTRLPAPAFLILGTYYLAQWLLASSTRTGPGIPQTAL